MSRPPQTDDDSLNQLRRLLLGRQLEELEQLKQRLLDREKFSDEVSETLPRAMSKSAEQSDALSQAMAPTIEQVVRLSIDRDINKFATALFPVIGPAIRKSIAETIRQLLQSLNRTLEYGLSWRGIKWRLESLRSGIPFAQIVMLNSLIYRVEQVFLIHRESGLLLNHVGLENSIHQDADMVSSMLTAIGDFVGDSFEVDQRQSLDTIQLGDLSIWIEQGPDAILAVAVRGEAPASLRQILQQVLEQIQQQYAAQLQHFSGDTEVFIPARSQLMLCMEQAQYKPKKKRVSLRTWLVLFAGLLLLLYWVINSLYHSRQQHDYVDLLQQQPGYVLTRVNYGANDLDISGLKDPLARDPHRFIALNTLKPDSVHLHFESYQSLQRPFVLQRIRTILNPPPNTRWTFEHGKLTLSGYASPQKATALRTMAPLIGGVTEVDSHQLNSRIDLSSLQAPASIKLDLDIDHGVLHATGAALESWREQAKQKALQIDGIHEFDDSQLQQMFDLGVFHAPAGVKLKLQHGVLKISGHAENAWIQQALQQARQFSEIQRIDSSQLRNDNEQQLQQDIDALEQQKIFFDVALSFNFDANGVFKKVQQLVTRIIKNAKTLSQPVKIVIRGHSDSVGSFDDNRALSLERADYVAQYLFNAGISPKYIVIKGLESPVPREKSASEQSFNRRVTFEVIHASP